MKKIEVEVEIAADAETVWRALSEGEELKRWFTLDARVTPGEGGAIWQSFGEGAEWESPIEVWAPGKHLRVAGIDYYIESRGGSTVLRLVHSGFGDAAWQDELDTLESGWTAFLENLKHYLERHPGEPRTVAYFRHPVIPVSRQEAFARTLTALGISQDLRAGDRYAATTSTGDSFEGIVKVSRAPINFSATLENWSDGFLFVEMEPGRGKCRPAIWISLYGDAGRDAEALTERIRTLLERAFA